MDLCASCSTCLRDVTRSRTWLTSHVLFALITFSLVAASRSDPIEGFPQSKLLLFFWVYETFSNYGCSICGSYYTFRSNTSSHNTTHVFRLANRRVWAREGLAIYSHRTACHRLFRVAPFVLSHLNKSINSSISSFELRVEHSHSSLVQMPLNPRTWTTLDLHVSGD